MPDAWNPNQYEHFKDERSQPFYDLLALCKPVPGGRVVDLGCGTGELTRVLHREIGAAETLGVDSSEAMLAKSVSFSGDGLRFARGDIASFPERGWNLVFSNAAIHWVDDHPTLFRNFSQMLKDGGQLAIQMPANHDHPSHIVAAEVAQEEPFRSALKGYVRHSPVLPPERYAELLDTLGFSEQHVRLQVYPHHLESRDGVVEWVKGTTLTDYQKRLGPLYDEFVDRYRAKLLPMLDIRMPYFFPFKRILLWGRRPSI